MVKNLPANVGNTRDSGLIPELGRSGGGNCIPLQYSCLENSMDKEPGRLQSIGSQKVGYNWVAEFTHTVAAWERSRKTEGLTKMTEALAQFTIFS